MTPIARFDITDTLDRWHEMVASGDLSEITSLLGRDAMFHSPAFAKPYAGPNKVAHLLQTALSLFEDFEYRREFLTESEESAVLEFSARLGETVVHGIDMIRFDDTGLIADFHVMVRPRKAVDALVERMASTLDLGLLSA